MKKTLVITAIIGFCFSTVSFSAGYIYGTSNLGMGGYPGFKDYGKPMKPFKKDKFSMTMYSQEVDRYVNEARSYVDAAENDITSIRRAIDDAELKAKSVVDEYNRFVTFGF